MSSRGLLLLTIISIVTLALCDSANFTNCIATVAKNKTSKLVNDLQCSYCAEGYSSWPCNTTTLCDCVTTAPLPPLQPWQKNRTDVMNIFLELLPTFSGKEKFMNNESACGVFGNVAAVTNYSFDYGFDDTKAGKGLFRFNTDLTKAYNAYINFTKQQDNITSQVAFVFHIIKNDTNWTQMNTTAPFSEDQIKKLQSLMLNNSLSVEEQANNFAENFIWVTTPNPTERVASANHCYFLLSTTKPTTTTITNATTTVHPSGHILGNVNTVILLIVAVFVSVLFF